MKHKNEAINTQTVMAKHQLIGAPTSFVIDAKGNIQAKFEGKIPQEELDKLFKG